MQSSKRKLHSLVKTLREDKISSLAFYFVSRQIKEGVKKTSKFIDRFSFTLQKPDLSKEMKEYFKDVVVNQIISTIDRPDIEMMEYDIISEDLSNRIYTYALNNALSFSDIILNQLNTPSGIDPVESLKIIKDDLWAYCIKITIGGQVIYSFRKTSRGKIVTDEPRNIKEKITSFFDSKDSELKAVIGETMSFDNKIDCIYFDDTFYVFKKGNFELLVGLEAEFTENANNVIHVIETTGLVEGIDLLKEEITQNRGLLKTLSNIAKRGNHSNFCKEEIVKMQELLRLFEKKDLKLSTNGNILLETNDDIKDFIKLLNDYYKQGMTSGKYYGSSSGRVLDVSSK